MIHVRKGNAQWEPLGKTLEIIEVDPMLVNYKQYDTIILNNAHEYQNVKVFAKLCKHANVCILISGNKESLEELRDISDVFED